MLCLLNFFSWAIYFFFTFSKHCLLYLYFQHSLLTMTMFYRRDYPYILSEDTPLVIVNNIETKT